VAPTLRCKPWPLIRIPSIEPTMPTPPRSRPATRALVLAGALLAAVPPAAAQDRASTPLATVVGDSIAYRVDLPADAEIYREGGTVKALTREMTVTVSAWELGGLRDLGVLAEADLGPDAEARLLASDSLLIALWRSTRCPYYESDVVEESRSLGGKRAAYLRGRYDAEVIYHGWFEGYVTVDRGVVYMLGFQLDDLDYAAREPLLVRIRDSFRFAPPGG
jgi:hypothetical protein